MNKYNGLLQKIASTLGLRIGIHESDNHFKTRLVYSIAAKMAYASLWDFPENEESVSVIHFKSRIKSTLSNYIAMYSELQSSFPTNLNSLIDRIYELFLSTGNVYHSPNRIAPVAPLHASFLGIDFLRGEPVNTNALISGLGHYRHSVENSLSPAPCIKMFQLQDETLTTYGNRLFSSATWRESPLPDSCEYLNPAPDLYQSYWLTRNAYSPLVRSGIPGQYQYYLTKSENGITYLSQLPTWMTEEPLDYLQIANSCLALSGTLPASTYHEDGSIVHLTIHYLFPPAEQNFLELYSWPETPSNTSQSSFMRCFDSKIFFAIKAIFESLEYPFMKE